MHAPINLFCGFDHRESIGFAVFAHSVIARASQTVALIPLASCGLPQGTNNFTVSRFLVPYLMGFQGRAIFMDGSDMLCLGDVAELDALFDPFVAVQCVKHPDYETRHPIKYRGTSMEALNRNYPRKNWASVMQFNCAHPAWAKFTPDYLSAAPIGPLLSLEGVPVGSLPPEWNCLVDEGQPVGKLVHWSSGIPAFSMYANAPAADLWLAEFDQMNRSG